MSDDHHCVTCKHFEKPHVRQIGDLGVCGAPIPEGMADPIYATIEMITKAHWGALCKAYEEKK